MDQVIVVENLHKTYGKTVAVEDVSFAVNQGEIFGILGPNGAGKTTTVECLQGLRDADGGAMRVLGLDPRSDGDRLRPRIGSQLQVSALPGRLTVRESLNLFASFSRNSLNVDELIERWGLADRRDTAFDDLSGGQRQRLFIALAFLTDPEIVFLDELTQGLDPQARRSTWELVREIRDQGKTVVLVTHFMDEAEYLCDRLAIIDQGKVVALDTAHQLIDQLGLPVRVRFTADVDDLSWLEGIPEVESVHQSGSSVEVLGTGPVLALVAARLVEHDILPIDLRAERPTLEDAFLALTGRQLRS